MTWYFLEAVDVLFFRDGRPFNAGEDHHAVGRFPPPPSVLQGVFRSHYLVQRGVPVDDEDRVSQAVGDASQYNGLRMGAPLLAREDGEGRLIRYFPTPADACLADEGGRIQPRLVRRSSGQRLAAYGLKRLLFAPPDSQPSKGDLGGYLSESDFAAYFHESRAVHTIADTALYEREARLGIELEAHSRSTQQGRLYEAEFVRPRAGVGLLVEMDGLAGFAERGVMRAGGEGRALRYRAVQPPEFAVRLARAGDLLPASFKVYFLSPAWFEEGWKPKDWGQFFDGKVELLAAAIGGFQALGGYDLLNKSQKPASRWLPAGSVYYFRSEGRVTLRQSAFTQRGAEIGYGQTVIGEWKPSES